MTPEIVPVTDWPQAGNDRPSIKITANENLELKSVAQDIEGLLKVIALFTGDAALGTTI